MVFLFPRLVPHPFHYVSSPVTTFWIGPEIRLVGDSNPYRPWLNVPVALTLFTNKGVDADYFFGNLMYSAAANMDKDHFQHKNQALYMRLLRKLTLNLRRAFFVRTGENPSPANRFFSWLFYQMGF